MIKAVFFDMDGVLTDSESLWVKNGADDMLIKMFGREIWKEHFEKPKGLAIKSMYDIAIMNGAKYDYEQYNLEWHQLAQTIYDKSTISPGLEDLIDWLDEKNIAISVVSGSPIEWVNVFTKRLRNHGKIRSLLSANDHPNLKSKPSPDPYLFAMSEMKIKPEESIVIEDSIVGVKSGKSSGAFTICFTAYHAEWEKPIGADAYAASMHDAKEKIQSML